MAKKQLIRLTESDLHRIIKESVNNVLKENLDTDKNVGITWKFDGADNVLSTSIEVEERNKGKFKGMKNHKSKIDESILTEGKLSKQTIFYESALLVASLALNYKEPRIDEMLRKELNKMFDDVTDIEIYFTSQYDFEFIVTCSNGHAYSLNPTQIYKIGWDSYMIPH